MKIKSIIPAILCILVGFFMSNFMFNQYDKNIETVFNEKSKVYFLQIGVYSKEKEMKKKLKNISTYIYEEKNNLFYAYVGITKEEENLKKLEEYYNSMKYVIYRKEKNISSASFLEILNQYDLMLKEVTDKKTIGAIEEEVISKYEEWVLNDEN